MTAIDEVLAVDQVAQVLGCEETTVEEAIRNGQLPAVKFGRSWRIPRAALIQRLNEIALQRCAPQAPKATPSAVAKPRAPKRTLPALP